ncbi:photosystem reaction center subunit H [Komagataeibacter xylinus]|uniref:PRC-barrel domain-containing protein n=2 Tax=Komagataeibacter swingsii TaxID=215220 RepID=A0A850P8I1_9PROT|nr:PRC-barrel domain-containing protein [Komagataeibacter swingsii]RFP03260.1 photosystem reaction center subunit H [Komagataeibacter xylinus]RFP04641.1 photosystem reaction center subunit H [Komagataeibacter xylinus]
MTNNTASGAMSPNMTCKHDLISSDRVEGTSVYSPSGEKLGTVKYFMVDKASGDVAYVVMSFGGFLGMGNSFHPLPWKTLHYDKERGGYIVALTREQLEAAPAYAEDMSPDWTSSQYGSQVDTYYGGLPKM